jgi:hypothetical protein
VYDPECALRLCRRQLFDRLPIQSTGAFVHSEIIAKANFQGAMIGQVPVKYRRPDRNVLEKPSWRDIRRVMSHPRFGTVHEA